MTTHQDSQDASYRWDRWPACPQCATARQCICPICQVAGTEFPLAEYQEAGAPLKPLRREPGPSLESPDTDEAQVLLMCPTCDEAFRPHFYRRCQHCGHDFHQGIDLIRELREELSPRVVLVAAGASLVVWALMLYFWILLR